MGLGLGVDWHRVVKWEVCNGISCNFAFLWVGKLLASKLILT